MALKSVKLIEPGLCLDCRFAKKADVETQNGAVERMIFCQRQDCDNWDRSIEEPVIKVRVDGELEART